LGLRSFSVAPGNLLEVKSVIRSIRITEAEQLDKKVLELDTVQEIESLLKSKHRARGGGSQGAAPST
jgi:phosphoenolpyruvate-protein kinase (PTS system EI component)